MSVELLKHNETAYENVKEIFENCNRAAVVHPTGTGKSFIALKLMEDNKDKKIIYLSPSVPIMNQLKKNIIETGTYCQGLNRITYQKLTAMKEEDRQQLQADIIIFDEFHHCGAPEWGKAIEELIKNNPNAKILGLSATPMRYFDGEVRDMAEELFDGNIASEMSLEEAIATGVLSEPDYTTGLYEYDEIIKGFEEKWQKLNDSEKEKNSQEYQENMQQLKAMLNASVEGLPELLESKMTNKTGRYIVYCKDIKDMQKKMQQAEEMFARVNPEMTIMSISSRDEDVRINARTIRQFEEESSDGKLKLLFSVNMLNEGYHLKDLDGVIMMRPTHSPTLFYQQLGRALSVGDRKQPIVIDLVNNIDTIKIIERFSNSLGQAKTKSSKVSTSTPSFSISADTRKIQEIVDKIDKLFQRRNDSLTYKEKFELMTEYIKETGEKIKFDTNYKGYNIGTMKSNLRQMYFNGTLKMDEELLKKFIASGIIAEEKERKRTSQQEKYEFLMQMVGKSIAELYNAKMASGLAFASVKSSLQVEYNRGTLKLTPEQIENLKKNSFLNYSREEQEKMVEETGLPRKYAVDIIRKYSSYKEFIEQYKMGNINYDFGNDVFCGYRGITISEQEMTEEQKLRYATLILAYTKVDFENGDYIDIDKLIKGLDTLPDRTKKCIKLAYGLDGECFTFKSISTIIGVTPMGVTEIIKSGMKKYIIRKSENNPVCNVKRKLQAYESQYKAIQDLISDLENIKSYITDKNGNSKEQVEDISFEELGVSDCERVAKLLVGRNDVTNIKKVLEIIHKEEMNERRKGLENMNFSVRTFNCLWRGNIRSVSELVSCTEEELLRIRNMGKVSFKEIKEKLGEMGLQLGQKIEENYETKSPEEILLHRCNITLEEYRGRLRILEEYRREKLDTELVRYNEARKYYMERENLFDPQGVVPAVSKEENNILGQIEEGNNDELSGTMQIEDKGIGELEQKKKNELINSIRDSQQELEQLKQRLECRGISLDD